MAFEVFGRSVDRVAVIGSGQIGPDIALHFSKVLAAHGVQIVVVDVSQEALDRGQEKLKKKIDRGVQTGAFSEELGQSIAGHVSFTSDYAAIRGSALVVEAATENLEIKCKIFKEVEAIVDASTLLTSNSSHLEPERVFGSLKHPERCLITHYFFPAERNPALEIVPGKSTSEEVTRFAMKFYEAIGKVPVRVTSRYGFAVDPIFEGLFLAALLLVDEGFGTVKEVDQIARKTLGQGVGPFTAMNLAGGNPITNSGMPQYHESVHKWFHSPESLQKAAESNSVWPTAERGEVLDVEPGKAQLIRDRMLGAYLDRKSVV